MPAFWMTDAVPCGRQVRRCLRSSASFRPEEFRDTYRENVGRLIEEKKMGRKVTVIKQPRKTPVMDLMGALKLSLKSTTAKTTSGKEKRSQITKRKSGKRRKAAGSCTESKTPGAELINDPWYKNAFYALASGDSRPLVKALKSTKPRPGHGSMGPVPAESRRARFGAVERRATASGIH
jgi:hypothetical protein